MLAKSVFVGEICMLVKTFTNMQLLLTYLREFMLVKIIKTVSLIYNEEGKVCDLVYVYDHVRRELPRIWYSIIRVLVRYITAESTNYGKYGIRLFV